VTLPRAAQPICELGLLGDALLLADGGDGDRCADLHLAVGFEPFVASVLRRLARPR
jgi:hypothetical protein